MQILVKRAYLLTMNPVTWLLRKIKLLSGELEWHLYRVERSLDKERQR